MAREKILLAEDDEIMRITLADHLVKNGWKVDEVEDGRAALALLEQNYYHLVLSDIRMPGLSGTRLLDAVIGMSPHPPEVILMTAYGSVEDAVECMKKGAVDYLLKPFDLDDLTIRINRRFEIQAMRERYVTLEESCLGCKTAIIGSSEPIRRLLALIGQVAVSDATVLITGESGTGKELVAAAIHQGSRRSKGPYVRINCAAIPEGLMESELFGHEKGAFTGASSRQIGKFEQADGGTMLLDEIGELPLALQAKLLRVLQEREIERVGGSRSIPIDVRILCATARNLGDLVKEGRFREDLLYRLRVIPIEVPPLRERREDIPELCRYFLTEFGRERVRPLVFSDQAMALLMQYTFPGNIRELRNIVERGSVLAREEVIEPCHLPAELRGGEPVVSAGGAVMRLAEAVACAEKECLARALTHCGGKKTEAAQVLGISRKNLWEKMNLYRL